MSTADAPLFVVGSGRSGTSLLRAMLNAHPNLHLTHEASFYLDARGNASADDGRAWFDRYARTFSFAFLGVGRSEVTDQLDGLPAPTRRDVVAAVMRAAAAQRGKTRFGDKTPAHAQQLATIAAEFPGARFVQVVRDPRAVCWSNFRYFFAGQGNNFAYDLEDVANYFVMYSDLMDFWRRRFPNRIYDMNYRALTEDPETTAREMFDFLGLEWQPDCLDFHHRKRMIQTVSKAQIRKKIYTGSSEEWRRYEAHLQPMIRILEDAGLV